MASERILALNAGAGHITLGEFRVSHGKAPELLRYGVAPLGLEPDSDLDPSGFVIAATNDLMKSCGIKPGPLMLAVSGQMVFPRFVKFPAISQDKLRGMIRSEAEQNVPFPIDELTWDFQMIGSDDMGERNAMIVAAKTDNVVALTNSVGAARLEPEVVDVAPLAIYNCVVGSYPSADGCTLVLDIGSRSTNLIFVEQGKVFYRSIPVAGNAITHEVAKTFGIEFRAAEQMKREIGFVALGGVTATEDETADKLSKCIRGVVTRLHAEVNRSINFYRSQQGGSAPSRVLLTGGSAALQHLDTFFREKLRVDVDYLNPFGGITLGSHVNGEKASEDFAQLAEIVGLALRRSGLGTVEINLMPPNLVAKKTIRRQTPVVALAGGLLLAASVLVLLAGKEKAAVAERERDRYDARIGEFDGIGRQIADREARLAEIERDIGEYRDLFNSRQHILRCWDAVRGSLLKGMWIVSLETVEIDIRQDGENDGEGGDSRRQPGKTPGFRIVIHGFLDALRLNVRDKTAPEVFCERLGAKAPFENVRVASQRAADANNVVEFTVEAPFAKVGPNGEMDGKAVKR